MVSLVIADEKLASFCTALMDEGLREVLLSMERGPLNRSQISEMLNIGDEDAKAKLENLISNGLVRRASCTDAPDLYSLEFSMEMIGGYPDTEIAAALSGKLSEAFISFIESNSEKISAVCDATGSSLGRTVEQLFLSSVSSIVKNLQNELLDEDRRLGEAYGRSSK